MTDAVEALACALFLSTKCFRSVLDWISDIKLIPIKLATDMIEKFRYNVDYTLRLYRPLDHYKLSIGDTVKELFLKYFAVEDVDVNLMQLLLGNMDLGPDQTGSLGDAYKSFADLKGQALISAASNVLDFFQDRILRYRFRNPMLLIEALTHRSARDPLELGVCYEKLEVLGDSILDYLCNFSLLHYTMFERYKQKDFTVY